MHRWFLLVAVAACGGGDDAGDPGSCLPDGFAEGESVIGGVPLGPFVRAGVIANELGSALVFDEQAAACGEHVSAGRHLVIQLCAPPEPKAYRVVGRQLFRCPGDDVLAFVEEDALDVAVATTGTLTIDDAAGCVRGSYTVEFNGETIGGVFDAVACE